MPAPDRGCPRRDRNGWTAAVPSGPASPEEHGQLEGAWVTLKSTASSRSMAAGEQESPGGVWRPASKRHPEECAGACPSREYTRFMIASLPAVVCVRTSDRGGNIAIRATGTRPKERR